MGNKLDYMGIVALIVGSYVPALYYGFVGKPALFMAYLRLVSLAFTGRDSNITVINNGQICLLGAGCAIISCVEQFRTPQWRLYRAMMFIGFGLSGFIPIFHGVIIYGYKALEDRMSVTWTLIQGTMYIVGAILYAVRRKQLSDHAIKTVTD